MSANFMADLGLQLHAVMPNYEYLMFGIIYILLPLMGVIHIFRSRFRSVMAKPLWLFAVITMPVVGVVLYAFAGHVSRQLSAGQAPIAANH